MSGRGNDPQPILLSQRRNDAPQVRYVGPGFLNVLADTGPDFDHRLNHLGLDLLTKNHLAFIQKLRDVRTQLARYRIDDLELFFNAEGELIEHKTEPCLSSTPRELLARGPRLVGLLPRFL